MINYTTYISSVIQRSFKTSWLLTRIILPIMFLTRLLELAGLTEKFGMFFSYPLSFMGLPAEAGIVWAVTLLTGIYGGIGVLITLIPANELTVGQLSILSSIMLFAHAIPTEQAVVKSAGASFLYTLLLRVAAAFIYGISANWVLEFFGILQDPITFNWMQQTSLEVSWVDWMQGTAKTIILMFVIITALNFAISLLERIGVVGWISRKLEPFLRVTGQNPQFAPMTTTGLLLGLAYGGGLIIQQTREVSYSRRDLFMSLSCLSLLHSLIEDTAIMLALGADIWIILVGRVIFSIALLAVISKVMYHLTSLRSAADL